MYPLIKKFSELNDEDIKNNARKANPVEILIFNCYLQRHVLWKHPGRYRINISSFANYWSSTTVTVSSDGRCFCETGFRTRYKTNYFI